MISIKFNLSDVGDSSVHEFDLGNIALEVDGDVITSSGKAPDQSMMIFIAASDLLGGIKSLLNGNNKEFKFIGADSSFCLVFKKSNDDKVSIYSEGTIWKEVSSSELYNSAYDAAKSLVSEYGENLEGTGAALEDLETLL